MELLFKKKKVNGMNIYSSSDTDRFSIINLDNEYCIRVKDECDNWTYPIWKNNSFKTYEDAELWLNLHDWKNADTEHIDFDDSVFSDIIITSVSDRQSVMAAINTKNLANDLVRVRSSNIWSYGLNLRDRKDKTGDLLVQFKGKNGGAGDVYIYYDVPAMVYRRWQSAPSKGHYFWVYIRNNFKYSKLTGDKRGKLANAIN
ncbi:MAG: KTSC domain-containing protein [Lachnospiraceae bacterium]|nr:KTSC domain-containing protein [Lachnospiraceae bacterium]